MYLEFWNRLLSIKKTQLSSERNIAHCWLLFNAAVFPALCFDHYAMAEDRETTHHIKENQTISTTEKFFAEKVRLNGAIELNYEYLDIYDIGDKTGGSSSDFFISTAELALRVFFNEWSKAKIVVEAIDLGKEGDDAVVRFDEAIVTLKTIQIPLYLVTGKTVMPFGVFEDRLIEGTVTEEIYEIDEWGAIFGFNPDFYGLDISFSVYQNSQITDNLEGFNTHEFSSEHRKEDTFQSTIVNITMEPIEDILTISTFYNSEPGHGRRNQSIGGAFTLEYGQFTLDTEYITALQREDGENEEENRESAGVASLAFDMLGSLQLAARYEFFNDDTHGDQDEVLDYSLVAGFNYSLSDTISWADDVTLSFEYRYSKFEIEQESEAADSQNMILFQLALVF